MRNYIQSEILESIATKKAIIENADIIANIELLARHCVDAYKRGNKVLVAGNGGSAADAQHIAGELVSRFYFDRPGLAALALTTDTSILTAIGNDYGFKRLFSRQLEANGVEGDVFIGITTSGNSENIIDAFKTCRDKGITAVCLNGKDGGQITKEGLADLDIIVPSNCTPRVQESHILIGHIVCAIIEEQIFGDRK